MATPVVIATGNAHKAEEIQALLGPDFACRTLADFPDAPEVEETARTLAGNAALKALSLVNWLKQNEDWNEGWVLADDSGLEVDALDGAPGAGPPVDTGRHDEHRRGAVADLAGALNQLQGLGGGGDVGGGGATGDNHQIANRQGGHGAARQMGRLVSRVTSRGLV